MTIKISSKIKGYSVSTADAAQIAPPAAPEGFTHEADRRLMLREVPTPPAASLRWEKRPVLTGGNPSQTYAISVPDSLSKTGTRNWWLIVGHVPNGVPGVGYPFECFVTGEAPRGLAALCKSLSMDLRSNDRGWLKAKLESLAKVNDVAFDYVMPDGITYRMPSELACFAKLMLHRCSELGVFTEEKLASTPILDALMSKKEPKASAEGTLAWNVSFKHPFLGDDCEVFLKEGLLPDGQRRPFSLWLSGSYPKSLDGLCKVLSYDLRVSDLAWGVRKLKQLVDAQEPQGEFMAQVPGSEKSAFYPSTVAYIATLVLHRLHQLGWINAQYDVPNSNVVQLSLIPGSSEAPKPAIKAVQGNLCESCGAYAVVKESGCETCRSCTWSRCG